MVSGFALALARGLGEYGSVLFISGNLPMRTEIAPLLVVTKLEQFDETGAALLSTALLATSLGLLVVVHLFERWAGRRVAGREERS
jgi:sulfate transport system permease protein